MTIHKIITTNSISLHYRCRFLFDTLLIALILFRQHVCSFEIHHNQQSSPTTIVDTTSTKHNSASIIMSKNTEQDFVLCEDTKKPVGSISTGVGYLDHMIDQLNSHAQIGVTLTISNFVDNGDNGATSKEEDSKNDKTNRYADGDQNKLMSLVGTKLGTELKKLIAGASVEGESSSRFCCPLDEALVECVLKVQQDGKEGILESFTLPPYGKFPRNGKGRKRIGRMDTAALRMFWENLAVHSGLLIQLNKIRGDNAHHIVESAFKAFSRALRNLLDGTDTTSAIESNNNKQLELLYGPDSSNWKESIALNRKGVVERKTKETSISATLQFDGGTNGISVNTGIQTLDEFFITLAKSASISLNLHCNGDLWIDEHHTAEDVAIAFGQVLNQALGTKAGLNRMWCCCGGATEENNAVEVTMDLSNRPCLIQNLSFDNDNEDSEMIGDLSIEMFEHVLDSIVVNSRMTCHIVETRKGDGATNNNNNALLLVQAVAKSFGLALKYCAVVDSRRCGATASSKGTLSV